MLVIISPAKKLNDLPFPAQGNYSQPHFLEKSQQLVDIAKKLTPERLIKIMKISDKLAQLTATRFQQWKLPFTPENARQAIFMFNGHVYETLHAQTFQPKEIEFAQRHLCILSGLHGLLRPLDLIQPYRLEMGLTFSELSDGSLYHFWQESLTQALNEALTKQGDNILINLASNEYFEAIDLKKLNARVIKPVFLNEKQGIFKLIGISAKKARGLMTRFIITHQIKDPDALKQFNLDDYFFDPVESHENEWIFKRYEK